MNPTYFRPKMRGNVENKNNNPVNIKFVAKTSEIYLRTSHPDLMSCSVAARGENDREGCEISSLVEHIALSPGCLVAFSVTPAVLILSPS